MYIYMLLRYAIVVYFYIDTARCYPTGERPLYCNLSNNSEYIYYKFKISICCFLLGSTCNNYRKLITNIFQLHVSHLFKYFHLVRAPPIHTKVKKSPGKYHYSKSDPKVCPYIGIMVCTYWEKVNMFIRLHNINVQLEIGSKQYK